MGFHRPFDRKDIRFAGQQGNDRLAGPAHAGHLDIGAVVTGIADEEIPLDDVEHRSAFRVVMIFDVGDCFVAAVDVLENDGAVPKPHPIVLQAQQLVERFGDESGVHSPLWKQLRQLDPDLAGPALTPITELPQPGFGLLVVVRLSDAAVEKTALHRQLLGAPDQLMRHLTVRLTGFYCRFDFVQQALNEKNGSFVQEGVKIHNIQNDLSSLI